MWKRKELKQAAKRALRANYWRSVAVCFLIALLAGAYVSSTRMISRQNIENIRNTGSSTVLTENGTQDLMVRYKQEHPGAPRWQHIVMKLVDATVTTFVSNSSTQLMIFNFAESIVNYDMSSVAFLLLFSFILKTFYDIFIANLLRVGEKRFFMENRLYEHTKINKILYLYKVNVIQGPAWIMFCRDVFQMLWNLTIVGGIIKHYEYTMIPYIIAERTNISRKETFALSKKMMNGNKWKMFLLDVSFWGWEILGFLSFGVIQILFVNPYRTQTTAELYMAIRGEMIKPRKYDYVYFTDKYLDAVPSDDELLISKLVYDEDHINCRREAVIEKGKYPGFLYAIQPKYPVFLVSGEANYSYSLLEYIELFFAASFSGWFVELIVFILQNGRIVKRGFLMGPWMPLYGLLAIITVILFRRHATHPVRIFFMTSILGSALAYLFSYGIEGYTGVRYWDCSEYLLNLNGRICLEDAMLYGIAGCVCLFYLAPMLEEHRIEGSHRGNWILCAILGLCMIADAVYRVVG